MWISKIERNRVPLWQSYETNGKTNAKIRCECETKKTTGCTFSECVFLFWLLSIYSLPAEQSWKIFMGFICLFIYIQFLEDIKIPWLFFFCFIARCCIYFSICSNFIILLFYRALYTTQMYKIHYSKNRLCNHRPKFSLHCLSTNIFLNATFNNKIPLHLNWKIDLTILH